LIGIPFDRPVVGYGGKTINTLRLWAATARDYFDFEQFSQGDFVGALAENLAAESLTRVLYPDDSTAMGQGLRFVQEYFLVACALADLVRRLKDEGVEAGVTVVCRTPAVDDKKLPELAHWPGGTPDDASSDQRRGKRERTRRDPWAPQQGPGAGSFDALVGSL
jgi:hypothetical protein